MCEEALKDHNYIINCQFENKVMSNKCFVIDTKKALFWLSCSFLCV